MGPWPVVSPVVPEVDPRPVRPPGQAIENAGNRTGKTRSSPRKRLFGRPVLFPYDLPAQRAEAVQNRGATVVDKEPRILCETPTPGKAGTRIARWKYDVVRAKILEAVPQDETGVEFGRLVSRPVPLRALDTALRKWYNPQKIRCPGLAADDSRRGYGALLGPSRFAQ